MVIMFSLDTLAYPMGKSLVLFVDIFFFFFCKLATLKSWSALSLLFTNNRVWHTKKKKIEKSEKKAQNG